MKKRSSSRPGSSDSIWYLTFGVLLVFSFNVKALPDEVKRPGLVCLSFLNGIAGPRSFGLIYGAVQFCSPADPDGLAALITKNRGIAVGWDTCAFLTNLASP